MSAEDSEELPVFSQRIVRGRAHDTSKWVTPDVGTMTDSRQELYFARKKAVELYLAGESPESIKKATSLSAKQAYRLINERCLETHEDGREFGWRGLMPYVRMRPYHRIKRIHVDAYGGGAAGAMQVILDAHPELRKSFDARILTVPRTNKLAEIKRAKTRHHNWILDQLRALGYEIRNEWPFNTVSLGYYSIRRYVEKVLLANPKVMAHEVGGPDMVKKLATGDGTNRGETSNHQTIYRRVLGRTTEIHEPAHIHRPLRRNRPREDQTYRPVSGRGGRSPRGKSLSRSGGSFRTFSSPTRILNSSSRAMHGCVHAARHSSPKPAVPMKPLTGSCRSSTTVASISRCLIHSTRDICISLSSRSSPPNPQWTSWFILAPAISNATLRRALKLTTHRWTTSLPAGVTL